MTDKTKKIVLSVAGSLVTLVIGYLLWRHEQSVSSATSSSNLQQEEDIATQLESQLESAATTPADETTTGVSASGDSGTESVSGDNDLEEVLSAFFGSSSAGSGSSSSSSGASTTGATATNNNGIVSSGVPSSPVGGTVSSGSSGSTGTTSTTVTPTPPTTPVTTKWNGSGVHAVGPEPVVGSPVRFSNPVSASVGNGQSTEANTN